MKLKMTHFFNILSKITFYFHLLEFQNNKKGKVPEAKVWAPCMVSTY